MIFSHCSSNYWSKTCGNGFYIVKGKNYKWINKRTQTKNVYFVFIFFPIHAFILVNNAYFWNLNYDAYVVGQLGVFDDILFALIITFQHVLIFKKCAVVVWEHPHDKDMIFTVRKSA